LMKLDMALNEVNIVKLNKTTLDGGGGGGIDVNKLQEIRQGLAARRAAQLPKLVSCLAKEITDSSSEQETESCEEASIDFQYGDCDSFLEELNELYSYSEAPDLCDNYNAFSEKVASCCSTSSWKLFDRRQMEHFIFLLLQEFEIVSPERRLAALKCLAYLLQGAFMECKSAEELAEAIICNVIVAVECGVWPALCMLFYMEADSLVITDADNRTSKDGQSLRLVLICMYTIVETVRRLDGEVDKLILRQRFVQELSEQRADSSLVSVLLDMILKYCSGSAPYYPIRKLLLLLWKVLLLTLGGWKELREMKMQRRLAYGLHCGWEDTVSTACTMQPRGPDSPHPICPWNSAPSSKGKSDAVNLVHEVISVQADDDSCNHPSSEGVDTPEALRLNLDVSRQKEIIVKATAALLLLMLKHFKLNHVYQFELLAQQLVFANCIPLIVKFFDQNVLAYVQSSNELPELNYIQCALACSGAGPPLPARFHQTLLETATAKCRQTQSQPPPAGHFLWRNLFTLINLLRLLNKLAKWKNGRTMMLVVYKSAPILKRALRVRHMLLQLYALKLLKAQTRYLGKQWRKSNMELMSAIYRNVRHRLNDDWAYGNEVQSKSWDFQTEESNLMIEIDNFNCRRYGNLFGALRKTSSMAGIGDVVFEDLQPYDNDVMSVLRKPFVFSQRFKRNYRQWLEHEVFQLNIDWDQLLQ
ncbi:Striatin-interacting protein 1, partial [Trichinella pseudospiralis]